MINLLDMDRAELLLFLSQHAGVATQQAGTIFHALWNGNATTLPDLPLGAEKLSRLTAVATIGLPRVAAVRQSSDTTVKLLLEYTDASQIETVLLPMEQGYSLCVSTQVGCAMGCTFCNTGLLGFTRNLTPGEISAQLLVARQWLRTHAPGTTIAPVIRNLVFMGMGEPLLNLDNLLSALRSITHVQGGTISWRKCLVSSVGFPAQLDRLGKARLALPAISLHAPTQELREQIMPAARACTLETLMESLYRYPLGSRDRITIEYLLLDHVNDSLHHARQLASLLDPKRFKVNLLRYNPTRDLPYQAPPMDRVARFYDQLKSLGIPVFLRRAMGQDIDAACGQLAAGNNRQ